MIKRWLAIPLSRIPLLKYFLYPARIIIRRKPVAENQDIETAWLPYRYGVMPDGSEVSLGCTVEISGDAAEQYYRAELQRIGFEWLAPVHTKGSDFHPLDPLPFRAVTTYPHFPARTWSERRLMWGDYLACKHVPAGHLKTAFRPTVDGRQR